MGVHVADGTDEEVQRVLDSIDALGQTGDPAERLKRLTALLKRWPGLHQEVRAMRQQAANELHDGGLSYEEIGKLIDVSLSRARHIAKGITNPVKQKAKEQQRDAAANAGADDPPGHPDGGQ
jgi:DNA-directed RNA polymerase specialized sigma24 family protein